MDKKTISACACTFCGWHDPADMFDYETPGGAPVCSGCAAGIAHLSLDLIPHDNYQGDGSYQSGRPRVVHKKTKKEFMAPDMDVYDVPPEVPDVHFEMAHAEDSDSPMGYD